MILILVVAVEWVVLAGEVAREPSLMVEVSRELMTSRFDAAGSSTSMGEPPFTMLAAGVDTEETAGISSMMVTSVELVTS